MIKEASKLGKLYYETYKNQYQSSTINIEHQCFINAGIYNMPKEYHPTWFGTIRDPIDRYASTYYYRSKPRIFRPSKLQLVNSSDKPADFYGAMGIGHARFKISD